MNRIEEIKIVDIYNNNIVWGSINPVNGNINLYPPEISQIIETGYNNGENSIKLENYFNCEIHFKNMYQTTEKGFRNVFRENLSNFTLIDEKGNESQKIIKKELFFNKTCNSWYLKDNKITHVGFLADISGSMYSRYEPLIEKAIEFYIKEQTQLENDTRLYASTFSDTMNTVYNNEDIKLITDLEEKFYSQKTGGATAYYDSLKKIIDQIELNYLPGHEVIICIVTDGEDNRSVNQSYESIKKIINKCKDKGWLFSIIGSNLDVANNSDQYGLTREESINVGNTSSEIENVFRSLSNNINNVRKGISNNISYTNEDRCASNYF